MVKKLMLGPAPHSSIVIDAYRKEGAGLCTDKPVTPAEKVVFGISGCELCLKESIAQLLATDAKFAEFVSDCLRRVYPHQSKVEGLDLLPEMRRVLRECVSALRQCYEVECYPADGSTYQDKVLIMAESLIKTENPQSNDHS